MDQQTPTSPSQPTPDVVANKDIAALGYVWVLSVFVYLYRHPSPFVRFHAKQGIVLFLLSILFWFIPGMIGRTLQLLVLASCVGGFLSAAQGQWRELPIIYALSAGDMHALRRSWRDTVAIVTGFWRKMRKTAGSPASQGAQSGAASSTKQS